MKKLLIAFMLCAFGSDAAEKVNFFEPTVVPTPVKAEWTTSVAVPLEKGSAKVRILCGGKELEASVAWFARHFREAFGFDCSTTASDVGALTKAEAYEMSADPKEGVTIRAAGLMGVRHAFYTLRQIAIRKRGGLTATDWTMPAFRIADEPKLAFRGFHFCWFPEQRVTQIERQIRLAAYYKFNVVVLENWGVYRSEKYPWFGWKDGKMTPAEVRRLKAVADDVGVTLVPQLNVFGHASLSRVRTGNHAALNVSPEYEPVFEPYSGWNWCLSNPAARQMIKDLMVELHDLFGRPPYFHIGCDEGCPPTCPDCRATDYNELFASLLREVSVLMEKRGASLLMWHDMLLQKGDTRWGPFYANGFEGAEDLLRSLPKTLIVCDWYYGGPQKAYPTLDYFQKEGFRTVTSPICSNLAGIDALGKAAVDKGLFGLLQTNWGSFYGREMAGCFPRAACAAWGTVYPGSRLPQDITSPVNHHLRQVLQDMGAVNYEDTGFDDEQVPVHSVTR